MKTLWPFLIEKGLTKVTALADSLTLTEAGAVKLWNGKKLVGIVKQGEWTSVTIDAKRVEESKVSKG